MTAGSDDVRTRSAVVARLARAQKSNRGAGGYSRWVNRRLGRQFAAVAYLAGLTPNQVSLLSAVCTYSAIAIVAIVAPSWGIAVLVALLLVLGYALDSADGQVARLRGGGSPAGEWLDHVFDAIKLATFHLAVAICWFRHYDVDRSTLLVPLAFSAVSTVFFFAITLSDMLRRIERQRAGGLDVTTSSVDPNEPAPVLRSLVVLPNDYGVLCLAMVLLAAQGAFVVVYSLLLAANALFLAAGCVRWFREMDSLRA
jgi:phosphatidylglycerophosphate synthase